MKEVILCNDYMVNLSDKDFKVFLDKKSFIRKTEKLVQGRLLKLKKNIYNENNVKIGETPLDFGLVLGNMAEKVEKLLIVTKRTDIAVFDGDDLIYVLDATLHE